MLNIARKSSSVDFKQQNDNERLLQNDHELMLAVAEGDRDAFALLMGRHLKVMVAVAQRITGNEAEADEVAQEAFLRLWRHAGKWDPDGRGSVKTWLSRVVTNLCLDLLRRRRQVPLENEEEIIDENASSTEGLRQQDRVRIIKDLLSNLPARQKTAIVLSYYEEMSGAEIAQVMETTPSAVESLLVRARVALRDGMKSKGFVWGEDI